MSKKEKEIKDAKEIGLIILFAMIATAFVIGIWVGKVSTIHYCYMSQENEYSYTLNFCGTEHLYLKGE